MEGVGERSGLDGRAKVKLAYSISYCCTCGSNLQASTSRTHVLLLKELCCLAFGPG
jgi:hypothetical protein